MTFDANRVRAMCLDFPETVEDFPFGQWVSVFKVAGRIFLLSDLRGDPLTVSLKCDPDVAVLLRKEHPQIVPGYHLNKRHWNTVTIDSAIDGALEDGLIEEMIENSFELVVAKMPKHQRIRLR